MTDYGDIDPLNLVLSLRNEARCRADELNFDDIHAFHEHQITWIAADAIERLVAERKEWNATITAERERMDRLVEQITAERDALRKELEAMREIAANRCVIPKVIDELGPLSLWSKSEFEAEVQRRIDAAIREQEEKP